MIAVLDELTVRPGCLDALGEHIVSHMVPLAERRGLRLVERWLTPDVELGEEDATAGLRHQVLLMWAIEGDDDVGAWWRFRRSASDPAVGEVWRIVDGLVEQRTRRFLRPLP